jgi:cyclin T
MTTSTHFDVLQLPSLIKDGMSVTEEAVKRRKTCRFIEESGRVLKLPRVAIATAMVFFHRFYAKHAFSDHDRFEVAVASIVLAAKTEESPKKLNLVIEECYKLKMRGMQAGRISVPNSGNGEKPISVSTESLDPMGEEFSKLKERILLLERVLLHTIGFELSIDHPYKFLVDQIKQLVHGRKVEFIPGSSVATESEKLSSNQIRDKMMNQTVQWYAH